MADVDNTLPQWSTTSGSNKPAGTATVGTGWDDNLREIQGVLRRWLASKGSDILSASTADLGAVEGFAHDITGTTPITSFGTISAGIHKVVKFEGALTLTYNATSMILPGAASITTADGDIGWFISEGSGNWRCISYFPASGCLPFVDSSVVVIGSADKTKKIRFEVDGLTTATTRVITVGDKDFTIGKNQTQQIFTSGSGTYTTASGATRLRVRMVGGGGGGGAAHNITPSAGGNGGNTTFSTFTAGGGVGGQKGDGSATAGGGAGGTASGGNVNIAGGAGTGSGAPLDSAGGSGGASAFGGNGGGGQPVNSNGTAGATNSGGGGGGAGGSSGAFGGGGGGSGGYVESWINAPSATYSYAVGAAGAAGTSAADSGGAGGSGLIIVEEWYD